MKNNRLFLFSVLPFILVCLILLFLSVTTQIIQALFNSLFWGFLIPLIHFSVGHFANKAGMEKSANFFLILVLGGLVLRLFIALILIILVLTFLNVSLYSFIFTVFISYIYFLIIEIVNLSGKKSGN